MDRRVETRIYRRQLKSIRDSLSSLTDLSVFSTKESRIQQLSLSLGGSLEGDEGQPLYFTPYKGPIKAPEIDTIASYYPDLDESTFRDALSLWGYLNQYFRHCILPDETLSPSGSAYSEFVPMSIPAS